MKKKTKKKQKKKKLMFIIADTFTHKITIKFIQLAKVNIFFYFRFPLKNNTFDYHKRSEHDPNVH